jgi:hypothetical protein
MKLVSKQRVESLVPWLLLAVGFIAFYMAYFSPALLRGALLAPGDGEVYYFPLFGLPIAKIWNDSILSGYPVVADIQAQTFYVLRWLSPSFNGHVVLAYAIMAIGMFGLALKLTGSRLGALAAAIIVSGSGFMVGHLGHLSMIHAAAWIPYVLWAIASLRSSKTAWPIVVGALSVSLCLLGGHPQVSIIGLLLAGCYGLFEVWASGVPGDNAHRLAMLARVAALFLLGLMLAAPSLIPFYEAASDGVRTEWSLEAFNAFSHDGKTLRMLAFPNLYGANSEGPYGPYQGPWNLTELALYAGILPWFLALAAFFGAKERKGQLFWLIAGTVALLMSMGAATPLGVWAHKLPVIGQFRAQARFGIAFIICLGVLSAFGLSSLLRASASRKRAIGLMLVSVAVSVLVVASVVTDLPTGASLRSPAIWVPCALITMSIAMLAILLRRGSANTASVALLLLVLDLGSFGWFYEWRYGRPPVVSAELDPAAAGIIAEISSGDGRLLPLDAAHMPATPLRPNVNMRFGIPSVVGYGPLVSGRYSGVAGADPTGGLTINNPTAPLMDVLGVRWFAGEIGKADSYALGSGCGPNSSLRAIHAQIPLGIKPVAVRVISHLSCSTGVANATTLAVVRILDQAARETEELTIDAGEESAEWAYDRPDVRSAVVHSRPAVAEAFSAGDFNGLWFAGQWPLPEGTSRSEVEVRAKDGAPAPIRIKAIEVVDASGKITPLELTPVSGSEGVLGPPRSAPGLPAVRERANYRGMAWAVCKARSAAVADIVAQLGAGSGDARLDVHREALIEEGVAVPALACAEPPKVRVSERDAGYWKLATEGAGSAMVVISESYNRGWVARVDGESTEIVPVDGLVLGVPVAAGKHTVEVTYEPRSFRYGLWLALLALLACVALLTPWRRLIPARNTNDDGKDAT